MKFAEKCCEIAQMDLSEFFEAWGFFETMNEEVVGDYGTYIVSLSKEEADASRARMQRYEKKLGHLMFIEDRIKPSKREDGVEGYRIDFNDEYAIGKMGSFGQWGDYIDESVKAQGYYYARSLNTITIKEAAGAKGALGFKLYNAQTGELLDFNNGYKLTVPVAHANAPLKVVAAQADGTDYTVPNVADSDDEEMQLESLNATLATVKNLTSKTTTTGKEIGHFYKSALTDINALYNEAKAAAEQLLYEVPQKNGEWYFLSGSIAYRKGWLDEAMQNYSLAVQMDPNNMEYRQALAMMQQRGVYRPTGVYNNTAQCDPCTYLCLASLTPWGGFCC